MHGVYKWYKQMLQNEPIVKVNPCTGSLTGPLMPELTLVFIACMGCLTVFWYPFILLGWREAYRHFESKVLTQCPGQANPDLSIQSPACYNLKATALSEWGGGGGGLYPWGL